MNEIVNRTTALPANFGETLMKGIADTRSSIMTSDGGKLLLRLLKSGSWVFGQNNEPVEKGSEWAVNIASLARGWVCWDDGELLGQVMASVQSERIPQPAPVNGIVFKEQFSMELTCISGANEGVLVVYKNNSGGYKKAFDKLLSEIQMRWSADKVFFWPIVTFDQEDYDHKKYGQTWNPILTVVAWTDQEGAFSADSEPAREVEVAPPPVVARGRKPAPAASPAPPKGMHQFTDANGPEPTQQAHIGQRRRPASR